MVDSTGLLTLYSDIQTVPVKWLWYPYIAVGKITLLQGDPSDGKSTMMLNLIAELSKGGAAPDGRAFGRPQRVIYQCSEDGAADTIKPRLEASGADCRNVAFINEEIYSGLTLDDERIRQAIIAFRAKLIVIDPIQAYIGNDSDLQIAARARKLMRRLSMWASTYESLSTRERRRQQLELEFSFEGYYAIRKELYADLKDPAMTIRDGSINFNNACINALENVIQIETFFNDGLKRFALFKSRLGAAGSLRWCINKNGKRSSRRISCPDLTNMIYSVMKWDKNSDTKSWDI